MENKSFQVALPIEDANFPMSALLLRKFPSYAPDKVTFTIENWAFAPTAAQGRPQFLFMFHVPGWDLGNMCVICCDYI